MKEITNDTFDAEVLEADLPVIVDFYSDHCGPCRALAPLLEELANEVKSRAQIVKVNVATEEQLSRDFEITAVPTLIVFVRGRVAARMLGIQSKERLREALGLKFDSR
jgi:thioredoxin 1